LRHRCVVPALANTPHHAALNAALGQEPLIVVAGVLATTIPVRACENPDKILPHLREFYKKEDITFTY